MSPFWLGFASGIGSVFVAGVVLGIIIPIILFCKGWGMLH